MPVHDWTRAGPGTFHHFHTGWIGQLAGALNAGRLPPGYFAMAEQKAEAFGPDVIALAAGPSAPPPAGGGGAVAVAEPRTDRRVLLRADPIPSRRIGIRHSSRRRLVAVVEIVSPGNKDRAEAVGEFVGKVAEFLRAGVHAAVVDVFPPGRHDPAGLHPALCERLDPEAVGDPPPADRPLTFAGYRADRPPVAFLNYAAVGRPLPPVPLFLDGGAFVDLPLEETYAAEYDRLPAELKAELA